MWDLWDRGSEACEERKELLLHLRRLGRRRRLGGMAAVGLVLRGGCAVEVGEEEFEATGDRVNVAGLG